MNYRLIFPTAFDRIDAENDNLDVLVETDDGKHYAFVVATPDNLKHLMQKENLPFLTPGTPFLFVEKITEANIRRLMDSLLQKEEFLIRIYGSNI